jgi:rubrerythrin
MVKAMLKNEMSGGDVHMYDVLKLAEKFEIDGYKFYNERKKEVKNKTVAEIFDHLAIMEKEHTAFIRRLMEDLEMGREISTLPDEMENPFVQRYEDQKLDATTPEDDLMDLSVLRMAYLIEKDFVEFYARAAKREENPEVRKVLNLLSTWEEGHRKLIEKQMEAIMERNNLDLGFYPF